MSVCKAWFERGKRWAAAGAAALVFFSAGAPVGVALASEPNNPGPVTTTDSAGQSTPRTAGAVTMAGAAAAPQPRASLLPDWPFSAPLVGPLIKRAFPNDIEHRTTAFIPSAKDLSKLTPVKMPTGEKKWIRVDLSAQTVVAYEGATPIRAFVVSSGLPRTPTITGQYRIKTKVRSQTMSGGEGDYSYNLPNVQWVQYFYQDYSFHGTYWHNDFGQPKSHGCLNMTNADAKWLFDWADPKWNSKTAWFHTPKGSLGTLVIITE